ncbi:hypothetical protein GOP47_0002974 [Adiantum capillus-veneris]|uniref:DNA-directed DNA polymerase n=1 Tax=Adiantum capillus-veneris TaxID=13818 RepID=A0A9D4ZRE7_ADICA|nr:hypothetical protein GOP47_0002974 [Adiantum capillus-veneris]
MLEGGQPGELPLMKELNALKKSKGLRDPSTATSVQRSPVLEAVPSVISEFGPFFQGGYGDLMMHKQSGFGGSGRRDGIRGGAPSEKGSRRSPELANGSSRPDWDFPSEAFMELGATGPPDFHKQREELKYHLEKLGIFGDKSESVKQTMGGKSLLHNWRPSSVAEDDENDINEEEEGPFNVENYEEEVSPDMRHWLDAARDDSSAHGEFSAFQHEGFGTELYRRAKPSYRASRMPEMERPARQNAQILSPLVLNSHEQDLQRMSQSRSLFTLEEPYEEEDEYFDEEAESDFTPSHTASAFKGGPAPHSPFGLVPQGRRSSAGRKPSSIASSRHAHVYSGMSSVRRTSRAGPWDGEFLDYEVDSVEPSRKESAKGHHKSKNYKPPKYYSSGQEAVLLPDPRKMARRKSGSIMERQLMLRQRFVSDSHRQRNGEAEPLPLLTELEDYNESEDMVSSSVDGDGGRLSKRGEMEALNPSAEAHGHSLVRVEDKQNLQLAFPECKELALCDYKPRNLSQKYRPKGFEEVVGQHIVTQALSNAILRGKIAPVYLFQGSRGTGKTSAARIFAAALICSSSEERRPCGICRECIMVTTGKCSEVKEVDAASNNGIEKVKALLEETISAPPLSRYKVFIIDECHVLTTETWNALLKILEEPPMNVVFILITTDPDRLPRTAVSRCQKFPFPKIKDFEIVKRLQQLADLENFAVDPDTLHLIASRSDGSLRDAETTLDQLSLLGQEINSSTVYELVGSASDERMLSLLDSALLADTVGTVRRARELVDSGVEPLSLMSRLATLITDILAGSFKFTESQRKGFFKKQTLSEEKLEWLRMAMKTLSEAEKQLRVSNDRATWLTAALLQLGPDRSCMFPASCAGTSVTQSPVALDDMGENEAGDLERMSSGRQTWEDDGNHGQNMSSEMVSSKSDVGADHRRQVGMDHSRQVASNHDTSWNMRRGQDIKAQRKLAPHDRGTHSRASPCLPQASDKQQYDEDLSDDFVEDGNSGQMLSSSKLDEIWCRVVERCPLPLRQLLHVHGKLISISMSEVDAVIHLEVSHPEHKAKCERSQKTIANIFKSVLGFPVDVKVSLASLPAENEQGTRSWPPVGNFEEEHEAGRGSSVRPDKSAAPLERPSTKGYSLSLWKHGALQPEESERFPAIPEASFGSPVKDTRYHDQVAMAWNSNNLHPLSSGGRMPQLNTTVDEKSLQIRAHESRRVSPAVTSVSGNMALEEARRRHFQGMPESRDGYTRSIEYEDIDGNYSDGETHMDMQSPEPHDMMRPRLVNVEGPLDAGSQCVDGRRSCDTEAQKKKGSSLKMVRRLTMRSRTRSLPSSNPNSPDDRGSSRFATKGHTNSHKHREGHHSGEEEAGDLATVVGNQKKSKLKGAAGSFARFFKGSK